MLPERDNIPPGTVVASTTIHLLQQPSSVIIKARLMQFLLGAEGGIDRQAKVPLRGGPLLLQRPRPNCRGVVDQNTSPADTSGWLVACGDHAQSPMSELPYIPLIYVVHTSKV